MKTGIPERVLRSPFLLPLLLALGAAISISRGQDAAWDLKNYHLYNAWAFVHGHLGLDLAAAGLQSYFNPLLDLPYFWLGTGPLHAAPRVLAAFQGLWYGALVFVLCRVAGRYAAQNARASGWADVAAVVIGATGTMTLSQAGMSTNEVPLALLILFGFYVVMPLATPAASDVYRRAALAGLLCGLAAGLKPTAIVYAPALAVALWVAMGMRVAALKAAVVLGVASVLGFAIAYGNWGWDLWKLTGNPIFPMFNQVFQSSWVPASGGTDRQFMPKSMMQALFYPFWWLHKNRTQGGNEFADARYALAMLALLALASLSWLKPRAATSPNRTHRLLFTFVSVSYVLWLGLYSILRYAVPIEILTGLTLLAVATSVSQRLAPTARGGRFITLTMTVSLILVLGTTRYTDWGHAPFGKAAFDIHPGRVEPGSLVVTVSAPHAYVIPFLENADSGRFVGVTWLNTTSQGYGLDRRIADALSRHEGPMYAIARNAGMAEEATLKSYLPGSRMQDCHPIASQIEQTRRHRDMSDGLRICRLIPAGT